MSPFISKPFKLLTLRRFDQLQYFQVQIRLCHPSNKKLEETNNPVIGTTTIDPALTDQQELALSRANIVKNLGIYKYAQPYITRKVNEVYTLYERISGLDEVKDAQNRVYKIQDMVKDAQDRKRDLVHQLGLVRSELKQLHQDIMNCQRGESRYLDLIKKEIEVSIFKELLICLNQFRLNNSEIFVGDPKGKRKNETL